MNPSPTALHYRLLRAANDGSAGFIPVTGIVDLEGEALADLVQELADNGWAEVKFSKAGDRGKWLRIRPRIKVTKEGQRVLETEKENL